jgi:hypothetical protein
MTELWETVNCDDEDDDDIEKSIQM